MVKDNQIVSIKYLRGLAAMAVVFCHYYGFIPGQLGVDVFFFISGFIIVYSLTKSEYKPNHFLKFLLRRSVRIDPPYFVVIFLTGLFFFILSNIPSFRGEPFDYSLGKLFAHIFYVVPFTKYHYYTNVFWTLCVEFQFYLLIGLLYFISPNQLYKTLFLLAFSLTCFIPFPNATNIVFHYAPIFALGISLISFYSDRRLTNLILPIFIIAFIAYQFGWLICLLLIISCFITLYFKLIIKPLSFLGDISYSLYLTHTLVFFVTLGVLKHFHITTVQHPFLWLLGELIVAILFAYLLYISIEHPFQKLAKRIYIKD